MTDKTLIPAALDSGEIVVPVVDLDGSAILARGDAKTRPPALGEALQSVNAFAERLRAALDVAAPDKVAVEFSVGFTMRNEKITAMVTDGKTDGAIAITMEWTKTSPEEPSSHHTGTGAAVGGAGDG